jgi:hypothetical protein
MLAHEIGQQARDRAQAVDVIESKKVPKYQGRVTSGGGSQRNRHTGGQIGNVLLQLVSHGPDTSVLLIDPAVVENECGILAMNAAALKGLGQFQEFVRPFGRLRLLKVAVKDDNE